MGEGAAEEDDQSGKAQGQRDGRRRLAQWVRDYRRLPGIPDEFLGADGKPRAVWNRFFDAFGALAPDEIALHRLIIGERQASPDLGRMFAEVIMETGIDDLVELLRTVRLAPGLDDMPLRLVAEMLLGMVFSHDHFRLLTDDRYRLNRRALDRRIDLAIAMFCAP